MFGWSVFLPWEVLETLPVAVLYSVLELLTTPPSVQRLYLPTHLTVPPNVRGFNWVLQNEGKHEEIRMKFNSYTMPTDEKLMMTRQTMSSAGLIYTRQSINVTTEYIFFGRSDSEEDIVNKYSVSVYYTHHLREQQRLSCYVNFCTCPPTRRCRQGPRVSRVVSRYPILLTWCNKSWSSWASPAKCNITRDRGASRDRGSCPRYIT